MKPGRLSILPCMLSLLPSFINERFKQLEARSCLPENEKKVAMLPGEYPRPWEEQRLLLRTLRAVGTLGMEGTMTILDFSRNRKKTYFLKGLGLIPTQPLGFSDFPAALLLNYCLYYINWKELLHWRCLQYVFVSRPSLFFICNGLLERLFFFYLASDSAAEWLSSRTKKGRTDGDSSYAM